MATMTYNKRPGTGGVQGQLYETKLISLILFRLLRNEHIEEFYLASNYEGVGAFDDICFKAKIAGRERPMLVLIQAKHKENDDKFLDYDFIKYSYESLQKVKNRFALSKCKPESKCDLFSGEFTDTDCLFVLYTNAKYNGNASQQVAYTHDILNNLLVTGENSQTCQLKYTIENAEMLNKLILEEELTALAEHFIKFFNDNSMYIMNDAYISRYHVILAQHVVHVSDVMTEKTTCNQQLTKNKEWRTLSFRYDFFHTTEKFLAMLKTKMYKHILNCHFNKKHNTSLKCESSAPIHISSECCVDSTSTSTVCEVNESTIEEQIALFLSEPSAITLSPLLGTHISYENEKLKFIVDRPNNDLLSLKQVNVTTAQIEDAKEIAAKNILSSLRLKVPVTFGNVDLTIRGNDKKIERRMNHLMNKIDSLCGNAKVIDSYKVVTVEEGDGFRSLNGDIGGAIGNLLVHDEITTCLMFTQNDAILNRNARCLLDKLRSKINDLHLYRFDTQAINNIPKLVLNYANDAKEILHKVLLLEKQGNHMEVEEILKREIAEHQGLSHNNLNKLDFIKQQMFLHYHHKVQVWWLEKEAAYLTKVGNFYEDSISNIDTEPQMSAMHNMFNVDIKYVNCHFTEDATHSLEVAVETYSNCIVVTDIVMLTMVKLIGCLRRKYIKSYSVVDLQYMLRLQDDVFADLIVEIGCTRKVLIVVCNYAESNRVLHTRLDKLAEVTKDKNIIVTTDIKFNNTVIEYFGHLHVIKDRNQSLTDLMPASRKEILKDAKVAFQGQEVLLNMLVNDDIASIKESVLEKIIRNESLIVGKSLKDSRYEEINHLYIDRRVSRALPEHKTGIDYANRFDFARYDEEYHTLRTFKDINADAVLITSSPGMGKSTLLSHMSYKTNEGDDKFWIVRINLLEQSKYLEKWQKDKVVMNKSIMLNFMCQATLENYKTEINFEGSDSKIHNFQENTNNIEEVFELNLLLHFYNERKVIFLFDGFDEICPYYKFEAINFLKFVKEYARKHSMWVTTRSYTDIVSDLESILGEAYVLECLNNGEQFEYLHKFWQNKIPLESLTYEQCKTIDYIPFWYMHLSIFHVSLRNYITPITQPCYGQSNNHYEPQFIDLEFSDNMNFRRIASINKFSGTPLLLYLLAEYIGDVIINCGSNKSTLEMNIIRMSEMFITRKLTIFFESKYGLDISMPNSKKQFESEFNECIAVYKKIGAYVILRTSIFSDDCCLAEFRDMPFNKENKLKIESMIEIIKVNDDTSGLISHVTPDNTPIFIHRTFAEYFAVEFLCDIFKSNIDICVKRLLHTAIRLRNFNFYKDWIPIKRKIDAELDRIIKEDIESRISIFAIGYNWNVITTIVSLTMEQMIRIYNSTCDDYESDIEHFLNSIEFRWTRIDAVRLTYLKELVARMKPHLKQYFPTASSSLTPVGELTAKIYSLHGNEIKNCESAPEGLLYNDYSLLPLN